VAARAVDVCTIIAKNYVAHARVLARSFRAHHPDARVWVLVIDEHEGFIDPAEEPFELVTVDQLDLDDFDRMAALYTVLELSTAVKPWLLRHLMEARGLGRIVYLDPDIQVYDDLGELDHLLDEHAMVVTPHLTGPMPRDGKRPSETDILIAGSYNLGFLGLHWNADTEHLIEWWSERLARDCIVAPERGYFVDQRWIDFAPGLVPSFHVLRDPGYNVAYWNLPARRVERAAGGYTADGRPLRFFHYSGYDPREPHSLSKHQSRTDLGAHPVVRELCNAYGRELEANGFHDAVGWEYSYNRLPNGLALDAAVRETYRQAELDGAVTESVWEPDGAEAFTRLLAEPAPVGGSSGVTRYLAKLRDTRPDLKAAFPNLAGPDAGRLVAWANASGHALPAPGDRSANGGPPESDGGPKLGVNIAGYFESVLGVGEAARQVVRALEHRGVDLTTVGLVASRSEQSESFTHREGEPEHPVNLVCVNADVFEAFAWDVGTDFFRDRYTIGLWWWEVERFPERWMGAFRHVDEVWVGTRHIADALEAVAPVPVVRVPIPAVEPAPAELTRAELGLPEGFLFLFSFDYESIFNRKNPLGTIEAFTRAFEPGSGAKLVLKSINHDHHAAEHEQLLAAAAGHPDVVVLDRYVAREEKDAITAACDAYVSLHRSEGLGFTLVEAMALGKPVIATRYSGNLDYMTPSNSYLVDCELVPIGAGSDPYPADARWAEPDLDHAAKLMRGVFEDQDGARRVGERGREELSESHSLAAAGAAMAARLERAASLHSRVAASAGSMPLTDLEAISRRVRAGAEGWQTPFPRLRRLRQRMRNAVLRMVRPYAAHERQVDEEILRAMSVLDEAIRSLAEDMLAVQELRQRVTTIETDPGPANQIADLEATIEALRADIAHGAQGGAAREARIDDLAGQVDDLRAATAENSRFVEAFGLSPAGIGTRREAGPLPEAPREPWSEEYVAAHRDFIVQVLDDPQALMMFKTAGPLPDSYGIRFDERVVEFPWLFSRDLHGRVLDAGSTLNHAHTVARIRPRVTDLHVVTLEPEPEAYPFLDVSYLYEDIRDLPMRDGEYDAIVSLSTLEHVGLDNTQYGHRAAPAADPDREVARAMAELRRVLRPGGVLYMSVPYGRPDNFGWVRVFDAAGLAHLIEAFGPADAATEFFVYGEGGWRRAEADDAAGRVYRDHYSSEEPAPDGAVASRAVACVELRPLS